MRTPTAFMMMLCSMVSFGQEEVADSISMQVLDEVTVNGERPRVTAQDGILTVDLPAIVKDKPVTNILEALGYVPGVINDNGMIGLNGTSGVTIILNGELTNMPVSAALLYADRQIEECRGNVCRSCQIPCQRGGAEYHIEDSARHRRTDGAA